MIAQLKSEGYLQSSPYDDPRWKCRYGSSDGGVVSCNVHGTIHDIQVSPRPRVDQSGQIAQLLTWLTGIAYVLYMLFSGFHQEPKPRDEPAPVRSTPT